MKKESARSLRLTSEALAALKILSADAPDKSQGDIVSEALVEKSHKAATVPVIKFGQLDPQQFPLLQLEAAIAERHLREIKQQILRIRPQDKGQAEKLSITLGKVDAELAGHGKLRLALAKFARLGMELTPEDTRVIRRAIHDWEAHINEQGETVIRTYQTVIRVLKALLCE